MKPATRPWYRLPLILLVGLVVVIAVLQLALVVAARATRREIRVAYYAAAAHGLVAQPADAPDAVRVSALCGNGGIPTLVNVRSVDGATLVYSVRRDKSSRAWEFIWRSGSSINPQSPATGQESALP